jgi:hypothetical protein
VRHQPLPVALPVNSAPALHRSRPAGKFALPLGLIFWYHNKMKTARKTGTKKQRGRPATGQGVQIGTRWPESTVTAIDVWASRQEDSPARSEAIRRLVEIGLTVKTKSPPTKEVRPKGDDQKQRAREMAGKTIDKLTDSTATSDDQASRKRRLVKGPEEFQNVRRDRPNRK